MYRASDPLPGSDVLAPWANDPFLYPAVVVEIANDHALVAYWEGDSAFVPVDTLRVPRFTPGDAVAVNWKNAGQYWPAVIVTRVGGAVQVRYDSDGSLGWTTFAKCRVPA